MNIVVKRIIVILTVSLILLPVFSNNNISVNAKGISNGKISSDGGILRIAHQSDIAGLNPLKISDVWSWGVVGQIYDTLVKTDPETGEIIPWVARDWYNGLPENPDDNDTMNVTLIIRDDVYWHDGQPITMDDIVFGYYMDYVVSRYMSYVECLVNTTDPSSPYYYKTTHRMGVENTSHIVPNSVVFHIQEPYALFEKATLGKYIWPKHKWKRFDTNNNGWFNDTEANEMIKWEMDYDSGTGAAPGLIGCGPFEFKKWTRGVKAEIETYDNYLSTTPLTTPYSSLDETPESSPWYTIQEKGIDVTKINPKGRPNIDGVLFMIYANVETAVMALKQGDVDLIGWSVPPSFISELSEDTYITLVYTPELGYYYMSFNFKRKPFGYWDPYDAENTDYGKPFRKAVAHCVNKEAIIKNWLYGYGCPGDSVISPANTKYYNSTLPKYEYDTTLAKSILDAQGWIDTNGDGWREFPDKSDDQIVIIGPTRPYCPVRAAVGAMIANDMRSVGINAIYSPLDLGILVDRVSSGDFDMSILGWSIPSIETSTNSLEQFRTGAPGNYAGYSNRSLDEILDKIDRESNEDEKIKLVKEAQGIIYEDIANSVLYYQVRIEAYRNDKFRGRIQTNAGIYNTWSLLFIHPPGNPLYVSFIDAPSAMLCSTPTKDSTTTISVRVIDKDDSLVVGAIVNITLIGGIGVSSSFTGTMAPHGETSNCIWATNITYSNGEACFTYLAPFVNVTEEWRNITLSVRVTTPDFDEGACSKMIKVWATDVASLNIVPTPYNYFVIGSGENVIINISVKDQDQNAISDANITVKNVTPCGGIIIPEYNLTDSYGNASFTFTATVNRDTTFTIILEASKMGYNLGSESIVVTVLIPAQEDTLLSSLIFIIMGILVGICIIITIIGFSRTEKKREKK